MKTSTKTSKLTLSFMLIAFCAQLMTAQSIITIDNNPGSLTTYQTLQDAHDNAVAGDTIYVQPSSISYGIAVLSKPITIVGRSHSEIGSTSTIEDISINSSNISLKGLRIAGNVSTMVPTGTAFSNLSINDCVITNPHQLTLGLGTSLNPASIDIQNVQIRGNIFYGFVSIRSNAINILISNNVFNSQLRTYNSSSLAVTNNVFRLSSNFITNYTSGTLTLTDNMFLCNTSSGCSLTFSDGDFYLEHNLTYNYGAGNFVFNSISGGTFTQNNTLENTDPLFTDIASNDSASFAGSGNYNPATRPEDDLTLQPGSPALTGGNGGSQIGLYGNGYNYKTLGNPNGFPLLDVLSYDSAVPKNGDINVTIQAKAN